MHKVLIVDDDEDTRYEIGDFLETAGYNCRLAHDVRRARSYLESEEFQLIVSDFNMPGENGLDLLRYASSNHPAVAMIIMSGSEDSRLQVRALEMGAYGFMLKPFPFRDLLSQIMSALLRLPRGNRCRELPRPTLH